MAMLIEAEYDLNYLRLANPNRDRLQDSHPQPRAVTAPEEEILIRIKKRSVRKLPTLSQVLKATNGVNSGSAVVFHAAFEMKTLT